MAEGLRSKEARVGWGPEVGLGKRGKRFQAFGESRVA